jgi:hypothetical protein
VVGDHPGGHHEEGAEGGEEQSAGAGWDAVSSPVEYGDAGYEDDSVGKVGGFGGGDGSGDDAE